MNELSKLFWSADLAELKRGYVYEPPSEEYVCVICGARFLKGRIYPVDDILLEAEKAARSHVAQAHGGVFPFLLALDKKYTGLTEHQRDLLTCFYQDQSDKEIAVKMENGNNSTIRNQRFTFRERAKQAKIFLAIMELLEEQGTSARAQGEKFIEIPRTATMVDERFAITAAENATIIKAYFKQGPEGPLHDFPKKEKKKIVILKQLLHRFDPGRKYSEKEVNEILKGAFHDYVTLRRYFIEYGFMDRLPDGSLYWVKI